MKSLSEKEEIVMSLLWDNGPMFVNDMLEHYSEPRPHFNTVSTVVRGLEKKGYVSHKVYGTAHQYMALLSRDDYHKKTLKGMINKFFGNSYMRVVSALVEEKDVSLDELKELIRQVEEAPEK